MKYYTIYTTNSTVQDTMKNKEIIKKLQEYPEDYEVCVPDDSGHFLLSPDIKVDDDTIIICGIDSLQ